MSDDQEDIEEVVDDVNDMAGELIDRQTAGHIVSALGWLKRLIVLSIPLAGAGAVLWYHRAGQLLPGQQFQHVAAAVAVALLVVYYVLLRSGEDESYTGGPGARFEV